VPQNHGIQKNLSSKRITVKNWKRNVNGSKSKLLIFLLLASDCFFKFFVCYGSWILEMLIAILFSTFQSWQNRSLQVCMSSLRYTHHCSCRCWTHEKQRKREREKKRKREKGTTLKTVTYICVCIKRVIFISRVFVLNSTAFAKPASAFASMARKKLQLSVNLTSLYGETSD